MWGGRFERRLLLELERFSSSLDADFELYPFDIAGSLAHARGLAAAGVVSAAQLTAIEEAKKPKAQLLLMIAPGVQKLVEAQASPAPH